MMTLKLLVLMICRISVGELTMKVQAGDPYYIWEILHTTFTYSWLLLPRGADFTLWRLAP